MLFKLLLLAFLIRAFHKLLLKGILTFDSLLLCLKLVHFLLSPLLLFVDLWHRVEEISQQRLVARIYVDDLGSLGSARQTGVLSADLLESIQTLFDKIIEFIAFTFLSDQVSLV